MPESFKVLVKELQSLGLAIEVINEEKITFVEEAKEAAELEAELEVVENSTQREVKEETA